MTCAKGNSSGAFATPGLTSSLNNEDYVILLFSECPIAENESPVDSVTEWFISSKLRI